MKWDFLFKYKIKAGITYNIKLWVMKIPIQFSTLPLLSNSLPNVYILLLANNKAK